MTDTHEEAAPAHSAVKVLAALADLGEATATAVAEHAGLGYSTTTPKLRAWEGSGQAERVRTGDGRTLWRLTDAGRAATGTPPPAATADAPDATDPTTDPAATEGQSQSGGGSAPATAADITPPAGGRVSPPSQADSDAAAAPEPAAAVDAGGRPADAVSEVPPGGSDAGDAPGSGRPTTARRSGGSLRGAVLDILEAHPQRQYTTSELCKLIDAANAGGGAAKASAGAVANAATKLVAAGAAIQTVERPATYQLASASGGQ